MNKRGKHTARKAGRRLKDQRDEDAEFVPDMNQALDSQDSDYDPDAKPKGKTKQPKRTKTKHNKHYYYEITNISTKFQDCSSEKHLILTSRLFFWVIILIIIYTIK